MATLSFATNYQVELMRSLSGPACLRTGVVGIAVNTFMGLIMTAETQYVGFDDIARTVPIETGYVGSLDTKTESADKHYLREQGRTAVERFASDMRQRGSPSS